MMTDTCDLGQVRTSGDKWAKDANWERFLLA
jgi:hypothetical protein